MKTDKRQKKKKEKAEAKRAIYTENSIMNEMLQKKQKENKQAFVVLAGQEGSVHQLMKKWKYSA